jgi:Nucleotidyl transferase AbiEii toxin, Type IV TA system
VVASKSIPDDADHQSLLLWYPTVTAEGADYIRRAVKIESGAKSALDPHSPITIRPYIAEEFKSSPLDVPNITTVDPGRTFWDKVVILHGLRRWWERRGELRGGGQRVSRHYYDVHSLLASPKREELAADAAMAADCVRHARMFFNRPDLDLATAVPGTFALMPQGDMLERIRTDYTAMSGMIFGEIPGFEQIIQSVNDLETQINAVPQAKVE